MRIGVGLPNPVPGVQGHVLVEWAKRAEEHGFSTLATIDRIVYPSYESIVALATAAGATNKIKLLTNVILAPTRNPVLLAKEAASLDQLSGGRFILGASVGVRPDDFEAVGVDYRKRGSIFDTQLELMHRAWKGEPVAGGRQPIGPLPANDGRVPVLIGGMADKAIERTVKWGMGWTVGGSPVERAIPFVEKLRKAWAQSGREGQPYLVALAYYALGDNALERGSVYILDYYGDWGKGIAARMPTTPEALKGVAAGFEGAGFDELIFVPTIGELDQLERLSDVGL